MREALLFIHFIGLGMGVGTSFANFTLGLSTRDMPMPERVAFFLRVFALGKMGSIGFLLLILSGIGLMLVDGPAATLEAGRGFFHAKLVLVVALTGMLGYMHTLTAKAKRDKGGPVMAKIPKLGRVMMITTLLVVLLAVLAFR